MLTSRRFPPQPVTARLLIAVVVTVGMLGGAQVTRADEVSDQQQVIEQLAAELASLNERIAIIDEEHGAALDQQSAVQSQIAEMSAKVDSQQASLVELQAEMTAIALSRFVGGGSDGLSPLFSSSTSYSQAQQVAALSAIAFDTGAGTADEVDALVRSLGDDVEDLRAQQQAAADLVSQLDAMRADGEELIAEYTEKAAAAQATYGDLVQQEAERQATLAAEADALEFRAQQAAAAESSAPVTTVPAPRGAGVDIGDAARHSGGPAPASPAPPTAPAPAAPTPPAPTPAAPSPPDPSPAAAPPAPASPEPEPEPAPPIPAAPPTSSKAAIAVAAAYTQIGVPYGAFRSSPGVAFDCSGLTMWAWAQAGVSLPHQSGQQYASNPHVSQDQVEPGDLVFFYSPIHHVGIYVGDGMMIDAPHTGAFVRLKAVNWSTVVGISRPG